MKGGGGGAPVLALLPVEPSGVGWELEDKQRQMLRLQNTFKLVGLICSVNMF